MHIMHYHVYEKETQCDWQMMMIGKHTIFGRVKEGMRVVKRLGMVATDGQDRPRDEIRILRATAVE